MESGERRQAIGLFNLIAPIYAKFFNYQVSYYKNIIKKTSRYLNSPEKLSVLDIGCGTGALCRSLNELNIKVTGVDRASVMIKQAKRLNAGINITFEEGNVLDGLKYKDKEFDIVIASYVAHGLHKEHRRKLYLEASRLAKQIVVFHDYNSERAVLTNVVEWLEGGDYFNFITTAQSEMEDYFSSVEVVDVDKRAAWYICSN